MGANDHWGAVCIQDIITDKNQDTDFWVTTRQGHKVVVSRHFRGAHSTAIMIHQKLTDYIDYNEAKHDLRVSSIISRARAGHVGNLLRVQLFWVHMESAIGHDMCELDQTAARVRHMMNGKRFMKIVGAGVNGELIRTRYADNGIGPSLKQRNKETKYDEHSDMLKQAVMEWNMWVMNTYEDWWKQVEKRERIEGEMDTADGREDDKSWMDVHIDADARQERTTRPPGAATR